MTVGRPIALRDIPSDGFLGALFGGKPEAAYVVLWELADRRSTSFLDPIEAERWAHERKNVYLHAGLTLRAFSGPERPSAEHIDGLAGFWADIDVASPVHKKGGLPVDEAIARRIADSTGLSPSCVVHSGHGLQCWWLLPEPWMFDTAAERQQAATLVRAWDLSLRKRAAQLGATIDAVGDLPRLMRLPGTINHKAGAEPVGVRILELSNVRYSADDIEAHLVDGCWEDAERELVGRGRPVVTADGDLVLNSAADPPFDKLFALAENEPRVWQSWNRTRRDAKGWSASEYDQSLASFAAQAGWSRQEIANLLIASRRKHGDELKLRQDYYAPTIGKAIEGYTDREVIEETVATAHEVAARAPGEEIDRTALLAKVSAAIGVEITRVTRSRSEPPAFSISSPYGDGVLGSISVIGSNNKFRDKIAEVTNRFPRRLKNATWDPISQLILECAEYEDIGVEATRAGQAETLISLYLDRYRPVELSSMEPTAQRELPTSMPPFVENGVTYVFGSKLRSWLADIQHEMLTNAEFGMLLRAYGATAETRHFMLGKKRTTRSVWALPDRSASPAQRREIENG